MILLFTKELVMPRSTVSSGKDLPMDINVIIEIPAFSYPIKYEMDKETGALTVDRFMGTAMQYPINYGYIPNSLSGDGDPVDVLVMTPDPVLGGCVVRCRPIGMLKMTDEAGMDNKVLAVPIQKLTSAFDRIESYQDISKNRLNKISHFFEHYKDLEDGKWVKVEGWVGIDEACEEILSSIARYDALEHKPAF
jgi:inorganic pyrophosphatase